MLLLCLPGIIQVWNHMNLFPGTRLELQSFNIASLTMHHRGNMYAVEQLELDWVAAICSAVSFICIYRLRRCFHKCQSLFCLCILVLLALDPSCIKLHVCQHSRDPPAFGSEMMWIIQRTFEMLALCFSYSFQTLFSLWFGGAVWLMCNCKQIVILLCVCTGFQVFCKRTLLLLWIRS